MDSVIKPLAQIQKTYAITTRCNAFQTESQNMANIASGQRLECLLETTNHS